MTHAQSREDKIHSIETHVASICLKDKTNPKILIAKRTPTRALFPNLWECGGGQVHLNENFTEALTRQMQEEFNLNIKILKIINTYEINATPKIPGIKFLCSPFPETQKVSLNPKEHTQYQWVRLHELENFDFIPNITQDIKQAHTAFQNNQTKNV